MPPGGAAPEVELLGMQPCDADVLASWLADPVVGPCAAPDWPVPVTAERIRRDYFEQPTGLAVYMAAVGGVRVGHVGLRVVNRAVGHLCHVVVDPQLQRRGYGSAMVRAVTRMGFEELKLHRMQLFVFAPNVAAIACYMRVGFHVEGLHARHLRCGDTWMDTYSMAAMAEQWRAAQTL